MYDTILLGIATGMRTMTGIAIFCWASYLGYLPVEGTWVVWTSKLISPLLFTALALGEYYVDTLPQTPSRKSPPQVAARMFFGVLIGMMIATAQEQPKAGGVLFALVSVPMGLYGGYRLRMYLAREWGRDLPAALTESALALALGITVAVRMYQGFMDRAAGHVALLLPHVS